MMEDKDYPTKKYPHFDKKISYKKVKNYVANPDKVGHHSFLPFIRFDKNFDKYASVKNANTKVKTVKCHPKIRPIMYAAHVDGYIYKYYSKKISVLYDQYVCDHNFDQCVTAYRDNKPGKSNIHFAQEVFQFIRKNSCCYIIVSDYKGFFDTLNHSYLKGKLLKILNKEKMGLDYYNIFQSVTAYTYLKKCDIAGYYTRNTDRYFLNIQQFRNFRKKHKDYFHKNIDEIGIPQGTAISGLFANIYMIDIDEQLNKLMNQYHGYYRRYSDDSIFIIPASKNDSIGNIEALAQKIVHIVKQGEITFEENKTKKFLYAKGCIKQITINSKGSDFIDYLGFHFDGKNVEVRQKSIYKYARTAKKIIYNMEHGVQWHQGIPWLNRKRVIIYCSGNCQRNRKIRKHNRRNSWNGNFSSYIQRVQDKFSCVQFSCMAKSQVKHLNNRILHKYSKIIKCTK